MGKGLASLPPRLIAGERPNYMSLSLLTGKVIMRTKLKKKSGRWTTAKDAPRPKGLILIPENTEDGKKKKNHKYVKNKNRLSLRSHSSYRGL
jgi:hypothetical protein